MSYKTRPNLVNIEVKQNYDFLVQDWTPLKYKEPKIFTSEDFVDRLNKKVQLLRNNVSEAIDREPKLDYDNGLLLQNSQYLSDTNGFLKQKVFLLDNDRKQNKITMDQQQAIIERLQRQNNLFKNQINSQCKAIKFLQNQIKKITGNIKLSTEQIYSKSLRDLSVLQNRKDNKLSNLTVNEQFFSINKQLQSDLMRKSMTDLHLLIEDKFTGSNYVIDQKTILRKDSQSSLSTSQPRRRKCRLTTATTVSILVSPDKRFHRSPTIDRTFLLRNRVFQKRMTKF